MVMGKLISRVMKMKHLVDSISVKKLHTQSISSTSSPIGLLLKRSVIKDCGRTGINLLSILKYPIPSTDVVVENIDLPYFKNYPSFEFCGRTHGMVCLADGEGQNIMLCNPATSEFHTLPPSILKEIGKYRINTVGFGYDPKSKDFKVVRISVFPDSKEMTNDHKAEVYNLTTGRWTEIIDPIIIPRVHDHAFEMYYKGIYYWWSGYAEKKEPILTFDFTHEVFHNLPVFEGCVSVYDEDYLYFNYDHDDTVGLMLWNGSVVLLHNPYGRCGDGKRFDIWAMDYETDLGGVSWSKVSTIGPLSGIVRPLLFVNSDELVMEAMDGNMIFYNVITKEIKNLPMKGTPMKGVYLKNVWCLPDF